MPGCVKCGQFFCAECYTCSTSDQCCIADLTVVKEKVKQGIGRPMLPDDKILDPRSTMRKRAVKICRDEGVVIGESACEWRALANCGLAKHPVVGCTSGIVAHIHHIDKNTYNNDRSNLVGVCARCHNFTHVAIDPCTLKDDKEWEYAIPREATEAELHLWNDTKDYPRADHTDCEIVR